MPDLGSDRGPDWGDLYRVHVAAVSALAEALTDEQLHTHVPGAPVWTVHDVLAHLAGAASDLVTGRMDGAPGPEWTSRQVAERSGLPVADLVEELRSHEEAVAVASTGNPRPAIAWDIVVHHADLQEALGLPPMPETMWRPVLDAVAPRLLEGTGLQVSSGGATYGSGGEPVTVAPYELFRAVFSRRSRNQMRAWGGPALTGERIEALCIFGIRDDDQPLPA